jgi:hypothetical protein
VGAGVPDGRHPYAIGARIGTAGYERSWWGADPATWCPAGCSSARGGGPIRSAGAACTDDLGIAVSATGANHGTIPDDDSSQPITLARADTDAGSDTDTDGDDATCGDAVSHGINPDSGDHDDPYSCCGGDSDALTVAGDYGEVTIWSAIGAPVAGRLVSALG